MTKKRPVTTLATISPIASSTNSIPYFEA